MAQKSGFFNALNVNGNYDRKYNANDYTDNLAVIISNGVLRSTDDDLKVTAAGMVVSVDSGRAWIKGHYYLNDTAYSFPAVSAPVGGTRYDRVFLRFNNTLAERSIKLVYVQGTAAATPVKPAPTRTDTIYDLVLADIFVGTNATSLTVTDQRGDSTLCGWVYSVSGDNSFFTSLDSDFNEWFAGVRDSLATVTIFKRYTWTQTLSAPSSTVQFNIPQYDSNGVSYIEVYVNGIRQQENKNYTLAGNIITFANTIVAGTYIVVNCYKSIDGTGIQTVSDEITVLQNQVSALEGVANFTYNCTGLNDNISLSQIAQALYSGSYVSANVTTAAAAFLDRIGGNTFLSSLSADSQICIDVTGNLAATTPFSGNGTSVSRYKWFSLGVDATGDKKVVFDFSKCHKIDIWCATNTDNIIFYGTDLNIRNANVLTRCNSAGCAIEMIAGRYNYGKMNFDDCKFKIMTTGKAVISENGNFTNCWGYVSSSTTHALCFSPESDSFIRVIGGTYYAYTASAMSGNISAVFYTYGTATNGLIMAYNISCPVSAVTAFYQKYLSVSYGGKTYINGVVSTLSSTGNNNQITGQIQYNKR